MRNIKKVNLRQGFSLIESLISLSLFFFVVMASMEFFISARDHFLRLKDEQETDLAVFAGMDKIRIDIQGCGRGILVPQSLGIVAGIECTEETLTLRSAENGLSLISEIFSGQTRIAFLSTGGIAKGQEICIHDDKKGETKTVLSVEKQSLVLASPLKYSYGQKETKVISIEKIAFFLDRMTHILRRRVNASPAQPLLEEVDSACFSYAGESNLVDVTVRVKEEKTYAITVFPKNLRLVPSQETG